MTRRPDPPEPKCSHCHDWGTVRDPYDPKPEFVPCPYCTPNSPMTSHQRTISALMTRHGRNSR